MTLHRRSEHSDGSFSDCEYMQEKSETAIDERHSPGTLRTDLPVTDLPVTVCIYGIKDVTLPAYVLLLTATVVAVAGLIAMAAETVSPGTDIGLQLHQWAQSTPPTIDIAIWTPPVLLAGLIFEVFECTVVLNAFRRKARTRDTHTPA